MSEALNGGDRPLLCIVDPSLKDFVGHHFEYDAAVASGGRDAGYEVVCLAHRDVQKAVSDALPVRPTFTYDIWEARPAHAELPLEQAYKQANRSFLTNLDLATRDLKIDERTIVFGHMITAAQLTGWAAFAQQTRARKPTLVLLCRYELAHYRGKGAALAFRELERLQQAGVRIRLASDSERLARHFARLTRLPVEVFPIPHTQAHAPAAAAPPPRVDARPLVVSMLGNARDEKGWVELIAAIEILAAQGRAKDFRFVVQANNPDPACGRALDRLSPDVAACMELKTQALEPQAYAALLESSDVVVLPYWRSIYEARTSGVLVEALSAGKPVICTAATWLSDQITQGQGRQVSDRNPADLARQLWAMRQDYTHHLKAAQQARAKWVAYHNPASLVAALIQGAPAATPAGLRVAMLYPWGDAQEGGAGASLRVNLFARYLAARAQSVTVLEDAQHGPKTIEGIHFETYPLLEQGDAGPLGRRLRRWMPRLLGMAGGEELYPLLHLYPRFNRAFRRHVEEVVRSSDVVFLEYAFWASVVAPICRDLGKPLIITAHDVVADQVRSSRRGRRLTSWLEVDGLRKGRAVAVVSAADQAAFGRRGVASVVIPQFVDVEGLRAMPPVGREVLNQLIDLPGADRSALFVFVGSRFGPNEVAAEHLREIAAETRARHPDLAFHIVVAGSCHAPTREDGFLALGRVDEAVLPLLYQHATMVVIPLTLGTGASLKTAEAFGAGAPVLGTSVAFRGFEVAPEVDCIVEDDLSAWPERLAEVMRDPALGQTLRAGAVQRGERYDYRRVCDAYLSLAPELANGPIPNTAWAAAALAKAVSALVRTGWKTGVGEIVAPHLESLRRSNPDDATLKQMEAELLSRGGPSELGLAAQLFQDAFETGAPPEPSLFGLFRTAERLGDVQQAQSTARLAARLCALKAAHQDGDAEVREALWKRLHTGEQAWVHAIAGWIARIGPGVHMDYHYLSSLLKTGEEADHALGLAQAETALAAGFDRYWSLLLIARHQAALGCASEAAETLIQATAAASDEAQRRSAIDARLSRVWELFHRRELEISLQNASRLLVDAPDLSGAYYVRAECLRLLDRSREETIADYETAERLGYDPAWCRLHSGRLLTDARRIEQAGERLISAFPGAEDSSKLQCWRDGMIDVANLGVDHVEMSELVGIIAYAARLDPGNDALALWLDIHRPKIAFDTEAPDRIELVQMVGYTFEEGDYRRALRQARKGLVVYPAEPVFSYYTAECLNILEENLGLAEIYYNQSLDLAMQPFWPLMNRGQLRRKLGRLEEARGDIQGALQAARNELEHAQAAKSLNDLYLDHPELA